MTGQNLLNLMETLDRELQLQTGEADVANGLTVLNAAQDAFEAALSEHSNAYQAATVNVVTAADAETSVFPATLLRLDRIQFVDTQGGLKGYDLLPLGQVGGHIGEHDGVPWIDPVTIGRGRPRYYYTNGRSIYWSPLPDAIYTFRVYGLVSQADITAGGTFAYPDHVALPLASFAVRLMKAGVDDPQADWRELAADLFGPTIAQMSRFWRDRPASYDYRFLHDA